eukprot:UN02909
MIFNGEMICINSLKYIEQKVKILFRHTNPRSCHVCPEKGQFKRWSKVSVFLVLNNIFRV